SWCDRWTGRDGGGDAVSRILRNQFHHDDHFAPRRRPEQLAERRHTRFPIHGVGILAVRPNARYGAAARTVGLVDHGGAEWALHRLWRHSDAVQPLSLFSWQFDWNARRSSAGGRPSCSTCAAASSDIHAVAGRWAGHAVFNLLRSDVWRFDDVHT